MNNEKILTQIDAKIDEIDALLGDLQMRTDKRKRLSAMLFDFWEQLEDETEVMSSDWEA